MYIFVNRFEDMEINSDIGGGALFGWGGKKLIQEGGVEINDPFIYLFGCKYATHSNHLNIN
jgi:hypothetical protein